MNPKAQDFIPPGGSAVPPPRGWAPPPHSGYGGFPPGPKGMPGPPHPSMIPHSYGGPNSSPPTPPHHSAHLPPPPPPAAGFNPPPPFLSVGAPPSHSNAVAARHAPPSGSLRANAEDFVPPNVLAPAASGAPNHGALHPAATGFGGPPHAYPGMNPMRLGQSLRPAAGYPPPMPPPGFAPHPPHPPPMHPTPHPEAGGLHYLPNQGNSHAGYGPSNAPLPGERSASTEPAGNTPYPVSNSSSKENSVVGHRSTSAESDPNPQSKTNAAAPVNTAYRPPHLQNNPTPCKTPQYQDPFAASPPTPTPTSYKSSLGVHNNGSENTSSGNTSTGKAINSNTNQSTTNPNNSNSNNTNQSNTNSNNGNPNNTNSNNTNQSNTGSHPFSGSSSNVKAATTQPSGTVSGANSSTTYPTHYSTTNAPGYGPSPRSGGADHGVSTNHSNSYSLRNNATTNDLLPNSNSTSTSTSSPAVVHTYEPTEEDIPVASPVNFSDSRLPKLFGCANTATAPPAEPIKLATAWQLYGDDHQSLLHELTVSHGGHHGAHHGADDTQLVFDPVLIETVKDLEGFWRLWRYVTPPSASAMPFTYSFFRENITPDWEHPRNRKGGTMSICVYDRDRTGLNDRQNFDDAFLAVLLGCVGECFTECATTVNGVMLKLRQSKPARLQIWTGHADAGKLKMFVKSLRETLTLIIGEKPLQKIEYYHHPRNIPPQNSLAARMQRHTGPDLEF